MPETYMLQLLWVTFCVKKVADVEAFDAILEFRRLEHSPRAFIFAPQSTRTIERLGRSEGKLESKV